MIEVVNFKGNTITVREDKLAGLSICLECRGLKEVMVLDYYNPWGWYGGLLGLGHYELCAGCGGRGLLWRDTEPAGAAAGVVDIGGKIK